MAGAVWHLIPIILIGDSDFLHLGLALGLSPWPGSGWHGPRSKGAAKAAFPRGALMSSLSMTGPLLRSVGSRSRPDRLATGRLAAFSALAMPVAAAQIPLNVYLPALLSQQFGI